MNTDSGNKVVFLDLEEIESLEGIVHTVCEAQKHPDNPLLPLGDLHEWDSLFARPWEGTVIYDHEEDLFKSWYAGKDIRTPNRYYLGYAVSGDGVHWEKPKLGLFEYNGNTDNNICLMSPGRVVKDTSEPNPAKRYKMLTTQRPPMLEPRPGFSREHLAAYSPDGIHWDIGEPVDIPGWKGPWGDLVALIIDDEDPDPERRFKVVWQNLEPVPSNQPGPPLVKTKYLVSGPDLEHLTRESPGNPILTPRTGREAENHFLMLAPYAGQYVLPYEYGWYLPDGSGNFGSYHADIRLATSRGGDHFHRIQPTQKLIPRGRKGEWDDGFLVITDKLIVKDDTLYLYYCGQGHEWTSWPSSHNMPERSYLKHADVRLSRMGLATLRLDGFTCLETTDRETPGHMTTRPIVLSDHNIALYVNVSEVQQNRSWVEVEILHPDTGEPINGFRREECGAIHCNGIRVSVSWRGGSIRYIESPSIRLRFHLYGTARLHAFEFQMP